MEVKVLPGKFESRANYLTVPFEQVFDIVGSGDLIDGKNLIEVWRC